MTIDIVNSELTSSEEQNVTESAKTYKVNCDKRNITGMDNIAVQVLNSSQVILFNHHLNCNIFSSKTHNITFIFAVDFFFFKASHIQISLFIVQ